MIGCPEDGNGPGDDVIIRSPFPCMRLMAFVDRKPWRARNSSITAPINLLTRSYSIVSMLALAAMGPAPETRSKGICRGAEAARAAFGDKSDDSSGKRIFKTYIGYLSRRRGDFRAPVVSACLGIDPEDGEGDTSLLEGKASSMPFSA